MPRQPPIRRPANKPSVSGELVISFTPIRDRHKQVPYFALWQCPWCRRMIHSNETGSVGMGRGDGCAFHFRVVFCMPRSERVRCVYPCGAMMVVVEPANEALPHPGTGGPLSIGSIVWQPVAEGHPRGAAGDPLRTLRLGSREVWLLNAASDALERGVFGRSLLAG